jgi:aspartyl-tRNA(Asn)/glutamyl-tRNA(Gln) amidotransferase subunit A
MASLGHEVVEIDLPVDGWNDVFGPLVLEDEHRERGHLLEHSPELLTRYERSALRAALSLDAAETHRAQELLPRYRRRIDELLTSYDIVLTPSVAVPAFPLGHRPETIDGQPVDQLWGAFPFAVPFNVAGVPAASLPCGLVAGLPVGVQLISRSGTEQRLLDVSEQLEEALPFDRSAVVERWSSERVEAAS